jgi:hypothetical protein
MLLIYYPKKKESCVECRYPCPHHQLGASIAPERLRYSLLDGARRVVPAAQERPRVDGAEGWRAVVPVTSNGSALCTTLIDDSLLAYACALSHDSWRRMEKGILLTRRCDGIADGATVPSKPVI